MSQQTVTRAGPPTPTPAGGPDRRGGPLGTLTRGSTPVALARLRTVTAVVLLVAMAFSVVVLVLGYEANRSAARDTEQLIRAQALETDLLRADAIATNAFLVGGLESAEQRRYGLRRNRRAREYGNRHRDTPHPDAPPHFPHDPLTEAVVRDCFASEQRFEREVLVVPGSISHVYNV